MIAPLLTLRPRPPYDFALTARCSPYYTTLGTWRDGAYWRAIHAGDGMALVKLTTSGTVEHPQLEVYCVATEGNANMTAARQIVTRMFDSPLNVAPFYALARPDAALWRVIEPLYGLHILLTESMFEALSVTIIEQQIALSAAQRAERWLVGWAGDSIAYNGELFHTFPHAARLATASVDDLIPLKVTFGRMRRLIDVAQQEIMQSFEDLREQSPEAIYQRLTAIHGVGHWTAAWTVNRGMGRFVYVGSGDVALRAALNHYIYGQTGRADTAQTDAYFAQLGKYAGLAAYYMLMKWAIDRYPRG